MPKKTENVQGAAPVGTNDRIQHVLGHGETRSKFVAEAVVAYLEARERVLMCHDFARDPSRQGYYCRNCGNPRMHHLAQDVKRAAEAQKKPEAGGGHEYKHNSRLFDPSVRICVCGQHENKH